MNHFSTFLLRTALVFLFLGSAAVPARADWLLTPYLGAAFGGAANQFVYNDLDDEFEQRVNFGGSLAYRFGSGIIGLELDYNLAPNFFQFTGGTNNFDLLDLDSSVQTVMGNLVFSIPVGGRDGRFQPYVTAGLGTIRTNLRSESDVFDAITSDDSGFSLGAGAHVFAGRHFGIRADARYIRGFESIDDEDPIEDSPFFDQPFATEVFNFWRGTVGVTFRW
jgi:opacity protein-like surface antigen